MSSFLWHLTRVFAGFTFLSLIILSIPLAFDVGGRDCGLTYSLSLAIFYFILSTARMVTPASPCWRGMRVLLSVAGTAQHLVVVPGLLIYALNKFSDDNDGGGGKNGGYIHGEGWNPSWVDRLSIVPWDNFLTFSTPVFQLCEGFCSLLVIQAVGQISRWLVNRNKSDSWMIALLVMSGSIISSSVYFLWRITTFPEIGNIDASLIGVAVTCAIFLCAYGIGSGRGNPIESSLLFSYIVLCLYQIFTDYKPSSPYPATTTSPPEKPDFPPFPPLIMASYSSIVASLSSYLPEFLRQIASFGISAFATITPSVVISLAYRLFVFYAATRIIPAVRDVNSASVRGGEAMSRTLGWYSPCILVSVYTHLLMQHLEVAGGEAGVGAGSWEGGMPVGGQVWRWVNVGATMVLYVFELKHGDNDGGESLTSHWKND